MGRGLNMARLSLLLVEDNPDESHLVCEAFADVDGQIEVAVVASVDEAFELLARLPDENLPCLVVTDHHLSDRCGQELIAGLRASPRTRGLATVMVSGDAMRPPGTDDIDWYGKPDTWSGWRNLAQILVRRLLPG
jgi:CheY-like chemotaxis protein